MKPEFNYLTVAQFASVDILGNVNASAIFSTVNIAKGKSLVIMDVYVIGEFTMPDGELPTSVGVKLLDPNGKTVSESQLTRQDHPQAERKDKYNIVSKLSSQFSVEGSYSLKVTINERYTHIREDIFRVRKAV